MGFSTGKFKAFFKVKVNIKLTFDPTQGLNHVNIFLPTMASPSSKPSRIIACCSFSKIKYFTNLVTCYPLQISNKQ
jgi:hypothetical protein